MKYRTLPTRMIKRFHGLLVSQEINLFASFLISECLICCTCYLQLNEEKKSTWPSRAFFPKQPRVFLRKFTKKLRSEPVRILPRTAETWRIHDKRATHATTRLLKFQ